MREDATHAGVALNWALLRWPWSPSLLVSIADGSGDPEVWTSRSLRIALMQLWAKGSWNSAEESTAVTSGDTARGLYGMLPAAILAALCSHSIAEMAVAAAGGKGELGDEHVIQVLPGEGLSVHVWSILRSLSAGSNVGLVITKVAA